MSKRNKAKPIETGWISLPNPPPVVETVVVPIVVDAVETSTDLTQRPEIVSMPQEVGRFIPPACSMCTALVSSENRRTTYVDGTKRVINGPDEMIITRMIRCEKCRNTWVHKELIRHKPHL